MITFTDPRLYVQGIGTGIMTDTATGDIVYFSDKFQDGNVTLASDEGLVSAGIGNGPAIFIPNNPNVQVAMTAADYNEYAKSAAAGGKITGGAPVMTCEDFTSGASGTDITIAGTPVAGPGMKDVVCYVQKANAPSSINSDGIAYKVDPSTKKVIGFATEPNTTYVVTYYEARANATMTTFGTNIKGKVVRFVFQRPVYVNVDSATNQGDLWGMLYEIVPRLQLMPDGASNSGNQTSPTTTGITGRAIAYDAETISGAECTDCSIGGSPLMYRVLVPCDTNAGIDGILGALGGAVSVKTGQSIQLNPAVVVRGTLSYSVPVSEFTFTSSATGTATVGQHTGLVTGVAAGSAEVTVQYTVGTTVYRDFVNVEVTSA